MGAIEVPCLIALLALNRSSQVRSIKRASYCFGFAVG